MQLLSVWRPSRLSSEASSTQPCCAHGRDSSALVLRRYKLWVGTPDVYADLLSVAPYTFHFILHMMRNCLAKSGVELFENPRSGTDVLFLVSRSPSGFLHLWGMIWVLWNIQTYCTGLCILDTIWWNHLPLRQWSTWCHVPEEFVEIKKSRACVFGDRCWYFTIWTPTYRGFVWKASVRSWNPKTGVSKQVWMAGQYGISGMETWEERNFGQLPCSQRLETIQCFRSHSCWDREWTPSSESGRWSMFSMCHIDL
jgi:hypothetical protein